MGRNTWITAVVLVAALLFNSFLFPVCADQNVSGGEVLQENLTVESFRKDSVKITEEAEEKTEGDNGSVDDTEESEEKSLSFLLKYAGESTVSYDLGSSGTDESQRFTLTQVGLSADASGFISISSGTDLIKLSHVNPAEYSNKTLRFTHTGSNVFDTTQVVPITIEGVTYNWKYIGLDSFRGTISVTQGTEDYHIKLARPLFNQLSDQASIETDSGSGLLLMFAATTDDGKENTISSALLAETVTHTESFTDKQWKIRVTASDESGIMPPLIGEMAENSVIGLSVDTSFGSNVVTTVKGNANAGLLCASMKKGSRVTFLSTETAVLPEVIAESGDAGSLVGTMAYGSVLALDSSVTSMKLPDVTAGNGNAGGLVGSAEDVTFPQISLVGSGKKIEGKNAGGVIGAYTYSGNNIQTVSIPISGINISATGGKPDGNAGGIFGMLKNSSTGTFTFDTNATVNVTLSATNNAGGLIGQYSAVNLDAALLFNQVNAASSLTSSDTSAYGGLIGWVAGTGSAYIEAAGNVAVNGTANDYGGLIGSLSDYGHMFKVGQVTITKSGTIKGKTTAGGVVGFFDSGVLWLSDSVTTVTPDLDKKFFRGNYVGKRGNTLVFTTYKPESGWQFSAGSCNDIGNWGQILQVYNDSGLEGLLNINTDNHTVTVTGSGTVVRDKLSFAQAALRFQLNSKGALQFYQGNDFNLDSVEISVSGSIDLNGTGLTGFQRDDSKAAQASVTLNCENAVITFPDISIYGGAENNSNDNVAHTRQGLFTKTGTLTVNNAEGSHLILDGSILVTPFNRYVYQGALIAESNGSVTATNVTSETKLTIADSGKGEERISGLVAHQNSGVVNFTGCEWNSEITYNGSNTCYLGGLLARAENGTTISINNCTIGGSITKTGSSECYVGGLIASLRDKEDGSWKNKLFINGLTAYGVKIDITSSTKTGGILGWEWMTDETDIQGITVQNCILKGDSAHFGGLVYKGSGYWKVHDSGIKFESGNSFTGKSTSDEPSGLLLAFGSKLKDHNNALYLEIKDNAYTISSGSVVLNIGGSNSFDEIVGVTESELGNGIVSVGTGIDTNNPTREDCDYEIQLDTDYQNVKTRYYYNLDRWRAGDNAPRGDISSSAKMVLYSAYTHCFWRLEKYFYSSPGKINGDPLNLTGYSYYPAESYTNIQTANIIFDYQGLANNTRKPSDQDRQNYGMHTGLFTEVKIPENSTKGETMSVQNLTLSGTVGGLDDTYGAIIRGNAQGGNTNAKLILDISGVHLNNVSIYPVVTGTEKVAPLLINTIGSYTTLNMSGVETNGYRDNSGYAASSLIGNVGSPTASHIQLTFSDMELRDNSDLEQSVILFSRAWFLESFQYSGDSSGVYNFRQTDNYTLGQELSNTAGNAAPNPSGRNNGEQYCFFDDTTKVCNVVGDENADPAGFFTNYLRYVHEVENAPFYELDINLSRSDLLEGCGTYNDPYIIRTAKQLQELTLALYSVVDGMKIQVDMNVLNGSELKVFKNCHSLNETTTHKAYTCTASGWVDGTTNITENVRLYLRNAYYEISDDIVLSGAWSGLGADEDSAFCGVIDGNDKTITINPSGTPSQFGGLIKFSIGSVVKDLTVAYTDAPAVNCQYVPSNTSNASFFGGVVGWCLGGDTILKNVTVTGLSTPSVTGTNSHLAAVGGYVGMVGGAMIDSNLKYGGGVVFRGSVGAGLSNGNALANNNYFYVNPYVGRVLDGYTLSEDDLRIDNTNKNYQIPCLSSGIYLTRQDNTVSVSSSEGLWLLSAIVNSGAGAMQQNNCLAYTIGKARTGFYGDTMDAPAISDEEYLGGVVYNTKSASYLSKYYASGNFYNVCERGVSIVLSESEAGFDMTGYANGFRGIGTSYGTNANANCNYRLLQVISLDGNGNTVTLNQCRKEYVEEKDTWTSIGSGMFVLMGVPKNGNLEVSDLTFTGETGIQYFKGAENAGIKDLNYSKQKTGLTSGDRLTLVGVGMLTGSFAKFGTITNITCENVTVVGSEENPASINKGSLGTTFSGGLIGAVWNNETITKVVYNKCSARHVNVNGRLDTGGLIGYLKATTASIDGQTVLSDVSIATSQVEAKALTGAAGLLGFCVDCTLTIGDTKLLSVSNISVISPQENSSNDYFSFGGLVGAWMMASRNDDSGSITNVSIQGRISVCGGVNGNSNSTSGGIIGNFYDNTGNWNTNSKKTHLKMDKIYIATERGSSLEIYNSKQIGGLIGLIKTQQDVEKWPETVAITNIQIGSTNSNVILTANTNKKNNAAPQVGGIVGVIAIDPIVELKNIRIINSNLLTSDAEGAAGVIVGFADGHTSKATEIRMHDIYVENCKAVVDNDNANAGLLVGNLRNNSHKVLGSNILLQDCAVGVSLKKDTDDIKSLRSTKEVPTLERIRFNDVNKNIGSLVGGLQNNNKTIQLVGISIQKNNVEQLPQRDFGTTNTVTSDSYVIRADYQGTCIGDNANTISAESPYVTVNPSSKLEVPDKNITGDGAAFSEGITPMLSKILEENSYYNCTDSKSYLKNKINAANPVVMLTNFSDQELNTDVAAGVDFPVVALQTNSSEEANNCLSSVISMLTNWELCTESGDSVNVTKGTFYKLSAESYRLNENGLFEELGEPQSLKVEDNRFYLKPGGYDNKLQQFTLVDVAYSDPVRSDSVVYHLYIPVVVKKMFEYKFWASAKLGTTYRTTDYDSLSKAAIASHGENITALLNYEYQWSESEWLDAMENGQNLLWNFDLGVELSPYAIPEGTQLTLIDRNNQDQAYYAKTGSSVKEILFKDFEKGKNAWNEDRYLCDDLKLTATQNAAGKFYRIGKTKTDQATLRDIEGYYYKPVEDENEEKEVENRYNLAINGMDASGKVTAQFYLTLQTPDDVSGIVNSNIQCLNDIVGNLPTRRLPAAGSDKQFAIHGSENKIVLGDFFTQITSVTTTRGEEKMTETNAKIPLELSTQISFNSAIYNAETLYREYAAGQRLYQKFELKLKEYPDSIQTNLVRGTQITVQYYLGDTSIGDPINEVLSGAVSSYPLEFCWDDGKLGIPTASIVNGMELKAEIQLTYMPSARTEQFPVRNREDSTDGIAVAASSSLAYSLDFLRSNGNQGSDVEAKCGNLTPHFYREDTGAASLYYVAYENQNGAPAESISELGINGRDGSSFTIHSAALYNVSEVRDAETADRLKVTISLLEKQPGSSYNNLEYKEVTGSLSSYLSSLQVNAHFKKDSGMQVSGNPQDALNATGNTLYFDLSGYDPDVQIQIPITLTVLTGESFTGTYANYRIKVSAQLMHGDGPISNSAASDYIVYTNAKICQSFIES